MAARIRCGDNLHILLWIRSDLLRLYNLYCDICSQRYNIDSVFRRVYNCHFVIDSYLMYRFPQLDSTCIVWEFPKEVRSVHQVDGSSRQQRWPERGKIAQWPWTDGQDLDLHRAAARSNARTKIDSLNRWHPLVSRDVTGIRRQHSTISRSRIITVSFDRNDEYLRPCQSISPSW